ncbi:MAG: DUF6384 family protein [Pseudohongiellaceae bacterium]|jgi:hypothetical protein
MSTTDPRAFEEKLLTIDVIDGLRREQERLDRALCDAGRLQELRAEIQAYYAAAGLSVSEALIDQAIAERQAQRLAFKTASLGPFGHLLASAYVLRKRIVAALLLVATTGLAGWLADQQFARWQQQRELQAYRADLLSQLEDLQQDAALLATLPRTLPPLQSAAIPALPEWVAELQGNYTQTMLALEDARQCLVISLPTDLALGWSGEPALRRCHAGIAPTLSAIGRAQLLGNEHQALTRAATGYTQWQQRLVSDSRLKDWRSIAVANERLQAAILPGSSRLAFIDAMNDATLGLEELSRSIAGHADALACLEGAVTRATDVNDLRSLRTLLEAGQGYRQAPAVAGIETWAAHAGDTCTFFGQDIALQIINERGEDTGVWRYYGEDRSARSNYLIVDAVGSDGAAVDVPFDSIEDNMAYKQSRFGVLVSAALFENVRLDKADDGLLRSTLLGRKPANQLSWQLGDGAEARFIAEW